MLCLTLASWYQMQVPTGLVDLASLKLDLPQGICQVFLSLAFLYEVLLMGLHKKHDPMDVFVHEALTWTMLASAAVTAAEACFRDYPLLTMARIAGTFAQGAWFLALARIMFESHSAWQTAMSSDMARALYIRVGSFLDPDINGCSVRAWTLDLQA
ncbi:hypothetical protein CEUSTIGMA_g557.t1 [Chlamydomonas eustigma]|uniref:Uncharacterized protein n=1 Tax=Chlamydomonas eustigma TaxID=1157962 RepID=A0A250WQH4_9CHLO|nr:hypothetical protein CEUSTIGMA_g557.t1 [Chlamydomonas eustigma]|eukprot:GAX73104.1 hypothetical protein CEUSTIGMA_g557.t1 [Chlamydomonas eustigma]